MENATSEFNSKPVSIMRLPIGWAIIGAFAVAAILILLGLRSPDSVTTTPAGTEYRSTAHFYMRGVMISLSVITVLLGFLYSHLKGGWRLYGFVFYALAGWLLFSAVTTDSSNQHVLVTPTSILSEVGFRNQPEVFKIDLTETDYISFVKVAGDGQPAFDLVAIRAEDGQSSRIPVNDLMRAAIPQIVETISRYDIVMGDSESGGFVPSPLQSSP